MDKRNKRYEATDKKTDYKVKDRGDLRKVCDKTSKKSEGITQIHVKIAYPERGDSGARKISTNQKTEKMRLNNVVKRPTNEESKWKYLIHGIAEKEFPDKKTYDKNVIAKSQSELRKRIRDRYTIKLNSPMIHSDHLAMYNKSKKEDGSKAATLKTDFNKLGPTSLLKRASDPVERPNKQLSEETTQTKEKLNHSSNTSNPDLHNPDKKPDVIPEKKPDLIPEKKPEKIPVKPEKIMAKLGWKVEKHSAKKRKPMIKTIMSKTGPVRIFKAVTFVDQRNPTPLEIKIPGPVIKKQQKVSKFTETSPLKMKPKITVSKASIKHENSEPVRKKTERKRDRKFRHVPSPEHSIRDICPPTEVARWAPASIDAQTKPYYEAWVDTTLAAISKNSKKDKLFCAKHSELWKSFRKALEQRPESPELYYENFADENYAGRIKVRHKDRIRKK